MPTSVCLLLTHYVLAASPWLLSSRCSFAPLRRPGCRRRALLHVAVALLSCSRCDPFRSPSCVCVVLTVGCLSLLTLQQLGDGVGAHRGRCRPSAALGRSCPLVRLAHLTPAHRVAGGVVLHQLVDRVDDLGGAFFAEGLPLLRRRTRPGPAWASPLSSSARPRATVPGPVPKSSATWASPSRPTFIASKPA